jgi:FkbM family methyltransferase
VACFLDDTVDLQGRTVAGVPVYAPDDGLRRLGNRALVLVCIFSTHHTLARTRARLQRHADVQVASFSEALHLSGQGLPNLYLGAIAHQVAQQPRYERLRARLADARSRQVLEQHLRMRLLAEFEADPDARDALDFLDGVDTEQLNFVDGGAFDGDTLQEFLAWRGDRFARVVALEPDPANAERLRAFVATRPPSQRERIAVRESALWSSRTRLAFDASGGVGSALTAAGDRAVQTEDLASLDELPDPLWIKLDVEGAEGEVLRGGEAWIRRRRPLLAISVYHRPDDLLDLFEQVDGWSLPYRFHLRCHGGDGTDLMLYCVTDSASRTAAHTSRTAAASR